jgi:apolipoprotein N-acyltransferase
MGLFCGLVMGFGRVHWLSETLHLYGNIPFILGGLTTAALIFYLALYPALFFLLVRRLSFESFLFPWLSASIWILLEWVQNWMFSGFPWELMGYSQYLNRPVVQLAALTGVFGISFVLVLINSSLAQLLALRRWSYGLPGALLLCGVFAWGYYRLDYINQDHGPDLKIGVVQGSIPQDTKWRIVPLSVERYTSMTRSLAQKDSLDLIIFPETALPFRLFRRADSLYFHQIAALAREVSTPLLVGSLESTQSNSKLFNRAFLFNTQGQIAGSSDKVHLVPFGEYLPFPWFFQYMEGLTAESGIFDPGERHKILHLPDKDVTFGVFICYESIFPDITRQLTQLGARFLINTTNDAWFGQSAAPYQHFSMAVLRAVETGRPVIRAANTGISGVISPSGAILHTTPLFESLSFATTIKPRSEITPYVRFGNYIVGFAAFFLLCFLGVYHRRNHWRIERERLKALHDLEYFARHPRPLNRPLIILHGYHSSKQSWHFLHDRLEQCATNTATHLLFPDLNKNLSIATLADCIPLPAKDSVVDFIGHSMGGLLALEVASRSLLQPHRIVLLATPVGGTVLARIARLLKYAFPELLKDLIPSSPFIRSLQTKLQDLPGQIFSYVMAGDPVTQINSSQTHTWPQVSYDVPWFTPWRRRHTLIYSDPRPVRDLIALIQNRDKWDA